MCACVLFILRKEDHLSEGRGAVAGARGGRPAGGLPSKPGFGGTKGSRPRAAVPTMATGWQRLTGLREQVSLGRQSRLTMNLRDERTRGEKSLFFFFFGS